MKRYKFPSGERNFFINLNHGPYPETHCHDYWEFTFIIKGRFLHKIGGVERTITENTLLVIRPDDIHSFNNVNDSDLDYVNFGVKDDVLKTILSTIANSTYEFLLQAPFVEFPISESTTTYFFNMFNKIQSTIHSQNASEEFLSIIFVSVIRELLLCVSNLKQKQNYSPVINDFIERMRKPENLTLSIEDIIKNMNYSHCHIIRLFKKETGYTPSQYFLKIKLNYARSLLESTTLSVLDIASTVGFSSLGHFTEVFKKQYSLPPASYRRRWTNYYDSFDDVNNNGNPSE